MIDLLIISNYWHFEFEKKSSRYITIANMASEDGMDVEVVTSNFYHTSKRKRTVFKEVLNSYAYKTTLIDEPGYKKNIDLKRIVSHNKFANNVVEYLKKRKRPDVIYLFVPPLSLGKKVVEFANKRNIPIVIDVLDLWPEAFGMLGPFPKLTVKFLWPMKSRADYIYKNADGVVAVSNTYVDRVMRINKKCKHPIAVYIGMELSVFDSCIKMHLKENQYINIVYIGMLGKSYDLRCAIEAIRILNMQGMKRIKLIVMGDGPLRSEFERAAKESNICYEFTGRLPYEIMVDRLANCDIALNVISHGAVQSIINKHADYLAAGLPVINNQEVAEFGNLLTEYECGINCENSNAHSLAEAIKQLADSKELRKKMGEKSRRLAEEKFNRENTYIEIIKYIREIKQ